ncbi:hypothetical protein [Pediococcus pentosaceus]|uniref:hypothetical protein n=1 Tax=Pediococcus pentosaceus TaxID=1255 RepID=UPI00223ABF23|nr:hypothetical protein [Pediococcus pentosaceus]MCS8573798.1 hypothetical protein [Pediococcus pentosaceus]
MDKFLHNWHNHSMSSSGRENLEKSDVFWTNVYNTLLANKAEFKECYIEKGTLLYRVHRKLYEEPCREDFLSDENCEPEAECVKDLNRRLTVEFDNHWVSFTKSIDVITSAYFESKGLRGDVIIIEADKAIDISSYFKGIGFDEKEVVAPLDKKTLVEVLPYKEFVKKYVE